jgi:FkbM family methyltransferase
VIFLDELNQAVGTVQRLPRVRFDSEVGPDAENWLRRKHDGGAVHEPATLAAFLAIRNRYDSRNIFDLGALYGYFTLFALQAFGDDAKVTAFEMHPGCIDPLIQNVAPWARCVHAVVSDEVSPKRRIWISGFNIFEEPEGGWGQLETIPGAMKQRGEGNRGRGYAQVDFITLDSYCAENAAPDLIKIDVEAYQAKAILGGMETIRAHKPAIIVELHDADKIARMGTTNAQTVQPLFDCNYQAFWCGNFRDKDARFELVTQMGEEQERLSLMVFVP